ncbi:MAG: membrane protein insertase YidC [Bacteroidota bacterium]
MDRNSAIGLALIAVIFIVYIYWLAPTPQPQTQEEAAQQQTLKPDTIRNENATTQEIPGDSIAVAFEQVENEDVVYTFSNRASINTVELRKFKTYYQKPLFLATPIESQFSLMATINGKPVDLYNIPYSVSKSTKGDSTVVTYTGAVDNATIIHTYSIPKSGYEIRYFLETKNAVFGGNLTYTWHDNVRLQEKAIEDSRAKTTANWYSTNNGFDNISETAMGLESENVVDPIRWASFRQKFFVDAIIADKTFSTGDFTTYVPVDTAHVKDETMKLSLASADITNRAAGFRYYFGPNDYRVLSDIKNVESFQRNVYLGWPPVKWVNQFIILPIFHFLETFVGNYGVIIMILVFAIRLLLTPLSYSSYLGMAKMRLLKPELDLIKEKNGDNMAQAQQDQMKLYQQAGVNPFSGCIPLLLQLPILLAMFYFFPISIEFRQQHFLWAEDLSAYDSIAHLPFSIPGYGDHVSLFVLLMTASTLVSTWQNNQVSSVTGPMKSVSYIMPVIFLFILNKFSAALSFYYFVSNVFGFLQQMIIRRFVDEEKIKVVMEDHKKKMASAAPGSGKKSKFMAKLEEAMKASDEAKKRNPKK